MHFARPPQAIRASPVPRRNSAAPPPSAAPWRCVFPLLLHWRLPVLYSFSCSDTHDQLSMREVRVVSVAFLVTSTQLLVPGPFFTSVPAARIGEGKHSFASNEVGSLPNPRARAHIRTRTHAPQPRTNMLACFPPCPPPVRAVPTLSKRANIGKAAGSFSFDADRAYPHGRLSSRH